MTGTLRLIGGIKAQIATNTTEIVTTLLNDVSSDLQNNDISTALIHLNIVRQELKMVADPSVGILIDDAIQDLMASDIDRALLHLSLANQSLSMPSNKILIANNQTKTSPFQETIAQDKFLKYENSSYGVSIQHPSNWTFVNYDPYFDDTFVYVVAIESPFEGSSDQFAEKVDVGIDTTGQPGNLQEYLNYVIDSYNTTSDFNVIESDINGTLAGYPAYRLDYKGNLDNMTNVKYRTLEIGSIIGDIVYYIRYDAELNKYDDYLPAVQDDRIFQCY